MSPKAVLMRYRIQRAVAALDADPGSDLAALAAGLGWYDQSHFGRDFRRVVGTTPTQYLATLAGAAAGQPVP